jgi:hypothetical protein
MAANDPEIIIWKFKIVNGIRVSVFYTEMCIFCTATFPNLTLQCFLAKNVGKGETFQYAPVAQHPALLEHIDSHYKAKVNDLLPNSLSGYHLQEK